MARGWPVPGAMTYRLGSELRHSWRSWVALVLLAGVAAGGVLAIAGGARRTATAYEDLIDRHGFDLAYMGSLDDLPSMEGIERAVSSTGLTAAVMLDEAGEPIEVDDYFEPRVDHVPAGEELSKRLRGRRLDPGDAGEAVAHFTLAETYGLEVGDTVTVPLLTSDELERLEEGDVELLFGPHGHPVTVEIVGIDAEPGEFPPRTDGAGAGPLRLSPALLDQLPDDLARFSFTGVRVGPGAQPGDVRQALVDAGLGVATVSYSATARAIDVQAGALVVLAALAGATLLLLVGQALARHHHAHTEARVLHALGLGPRAIAGLVLLRTAILAAMAAAVAVAVAVGASPLFPAGLARTAEPDPGVVVDAPLLVVGALVTVASLVLVCVPAAWRIARAAVPGQLRGAGTSEARIASAGTAALGVVPQIGVRFALDRGRGSRTVPIGSSIAAATLGVATVVAAITFAASERHLSDTPSLYGFTWDAQTGDGFEERDVSEELAALDDDPGTAAYATGTIGTVSVEGRDAPVYAFTSRKGRVEPTLLRGSAPTGRNEVMLARDTARQAGVDIGDEVRLRIPDPELGGAERTFVVTGVGVVPELSGVSDATLGQGTWLTYEGYTVLADGAPVANVGLVDLVDGPAGARTAAQLDEAGDELPKPTEVTNFARVSYLPALIATFMVLLCGGILVHLISRTVHARRHDLTVLQAIGLRRRQVVGVARWLASTSLVVSLVLGTPLGVAGGRLAWGAVAVDLGVPTVTVVPLVALGLVVAAGLLLANGAAIAATVRAGRQSPAAVLRTE